MLDISIPPGTSVQNPCFFVCQFILRPQGVYFSSDIPWKCPPCLPPRPHGGGGHLVTWPPDHLVIWPPDHLATCSWSPGHLTTQVGEERDWPEDFCRHLVERTLQVIGWSGVQACQVGGWPGGQVVRPPCGQVAR